MLLFSIWHPLRPLRRVPLNIFCRSKTVNGILVFVLAEAVATINWEADATTNWQAVSTINWAWISRPLVWPTRPMNLTSLMTMLWLFADCGLTMQLPLPFTPSQNILQSPQKWRNILEYLHPAISMDDGVCAPSAVRMAPVVLRMFSWASTPLESVFRVSLTINKKVDALPPACSDFLSWHSPRFEELVARTWWGWTPRFNSTPMAPKEEKRTKHAWFELCLSFLRVEWEYTLSHQCKTSVRVDHR